MTGLNKPLFLFFLVIALLLIFAFARDANAYSHTGFKFDHKTLTYTCGSDLLAESVKMWADNSALVDGGCTDNTPDIIFLVIDPWPYYPAVGIGGSGFVGVAPPYANNLGVILHEVGHAIGMGHSSENFSEPDQLKRTANMFFVCCNPLNADDIAGIQALYGLPEGIGQTPTPTGVTTTPTSTPSTCVGIACITRTPTPSQPTATPTPVIYKRYLGGLARD